MVRRGLKTVARPARGIARAVRAHPRIVLAVAAGMLLLQVLLPPLLLSAVRGPWTYFAFNPWLKKLPGYLLSEKPLPEKLDFLSRVAVFWFTADGPSGFPEWGFAVDSMDLVRMLLTGLLFGVYFALWVHWRQGAPAGRRRATVNRAGGVLGAFTSVLGLSTGPCSVVGCGAPVLPVVGLAFAGLSSGTLAMLSGLSRASSVALLTTLTLAVAYLGWLVGDESRGAGDSSPRWLPGRGA